MTNTESLKFIEETANAFCTCYEQLGVLSIWPKGQIYTEKGEPVGGRVQLYHPRFVELFGSDLRKIKLEIDRVLAVGSAYPVTASIIVGRYEYSATMSIKDAKSYFGAKTVRPLLKEDISKLMAEIEAEDK